MSFISNPTPLFGVNAAKVNSLLEDWDNSDWKCSKVKVGDKSGKELWYEAYVVDVDKESKDLTNPDFFVLYDSDNDCENEEECYM